MKKFIYSMFALALSAMTFTSCEDVPMPFNLPIFGEEETVVDTTGAITVAATIDLINSGAEEEVLVKGIVSKVNSFNAQYGSITYYISDNGADSNSLQVYSGLGVNKEKFTAQTDIAVGDTVYVRGNCKAYNGNPELDKNNYIVYLGKGNGSVTPSGTPSGEGTEASPYNVAAALQATAALAADVTTETEFYVTGIVSEIKDASGIAKYGNISYYISDDGTTNGQFYVFQGFNLNGDKFTSADQLKVGQEVTVKGKLVNYKGNTPEMAKGNCLVSIDGNGGGTTGGATPAGEGTEASPFNVAKIAQFTAALAADATTETEYYVEGIVSEIKDASGASNNYGNISYYISDDGTTNGQFYIFRGFNLNNEKFTSPDQLKVGQKVVVKGKLVNYKGNTPEMAQGNYLISISGEGTNTPGVEPGNGDADITGADITVAATEMGFAANAVATTCTLSDGTVLTFSKNGGSNDPKFYDGTYAAIRMYAKNSVEIASSKTIAKIVLICSDPYNGTKYNGNDIAYADNGGTHVTIVKNSDTSATFSGLSNKTITIVNDNATTSGGTQLRIKSISIFYAK